MIKISHRFWRMFFIFVLVVLVITTFTTFLGEIISADTQLKKANPGYQAKIMHFF